MSVKPHLNVTQLGEAYARRYGDPYFYKCDISGNECVMYQDRNFTCLQCNVPIIAEIKKLAGLENSKW